MLALFGKLESPALTDVRLELPGGLGADIVPERIPDVYLGEPVTVALRATMLPPRVMLRGQLGLDQWEHELSLQHTDEGVGLSRTGRAGRSLPFSTSAGPAHLTR